MPSNIFATTGTNVSILFLDKENVDGKVVLMDASNLGEKVKEGKNQKTILSSEEEELIVKTFFNKEEVEELSAIVSYEEIEQKNHSFSAGQYFDIKIDFEELNSGEFNERLTEITSNLEKYFEDSKELESEIIKSLGDIKLSQT